jgi:hypothetical protein
LDVTVESLEDLPHEATEAAKLFIVDTTAC